MQSLTQSLDKKMNAKSVIEYMAVVGQQAREASSLIARSETAQKNAALLATAHAIQTSQNDLIEANKKDLAASKEKGLSAPMLDRLELTPARIETMIEGLHQVAALPDPVGSITDMDYRPSGIQLGKMRVSFRGDRHHLRVTPPM